MSEIVKRLLFVLLALDVLLTSCFDSKEAQRTQTFARKVAEMNSNFLCDEKSSYYKCLDTTRENCQSVVEDHSLICTQMLLDEMPPLEEPINVLEFKNYGNMYKECLFQSHLESLEEGSGERVCLAAVDEHR